MRGELVMERDEVGGDQHEAMIARITECASGW
jgi:hypothetical protein